MKHYQMLPLCFLLSSVLGAVEKGKPSPVATPAPAPVASNLEDELLVVKPVPYHPNLVRDPFKTPTDLENNRQGDLVDDIGVKGYTVQNNKVLACVSDSRGNIRWLPVGYKFRDGEIVAIDAKAVTFHRWDMNSTNRSVYQTVVRPFRREEGKR